VDMSDFDACRAYALNGTGQSSTVTAAPLLNLNFVAGIFHVGWVVHTPVEANFMLASLNQMTPSKMVLPAISSVIAHTYCGRTVTLNLTAWLNAQTSFFEVSQVNDDVNQVRNLYSDWYSEKGASVFYTSVLASVPCSLMRNYLNQQSIPVIAFQTALGNTGLPASAVFVRVGVSLWELVCAGTW